MELWYVHILTNKTNSILYIGVTDNIIERYKEHKLKKYPKKNSAKYNCNKLVYFEEHTSAYEAVLREKQLKKWKRDWKINLIVDMNPGWFHLTTNWNIDFKKIRD